MLFTKFFVNQLAYVKDIPTIITLNNHPECRLVTHFAAKNNYGF